MHQGHTINFWGIKYQESIYCTNLAIAFCHCRSATVPVGWHRWNNNQPCRCSANTESCSCIECYTYLSRESQYTLLHCWDVLTWSWFIYTHLCGSIHVLPSSNLILMNSLKFEGKYSISLIETSRSSVQLCLASKMNSRFLWEELFVALFWSAKLFIIESFWLYGIENVKCHIPHAQITPFDNISIIIQF